jgi:hypothetical protein
MSLAVECQFFSIFSKEVLVFTRQEFQVEFKDQTTKSKTSRAFSCAVHSTRRLDIYIQAFCIRWSRNLQTTLASDLGEGLAVLAGSLGDDLLGHADAILAL